MAMALGLILIAAAVIGSDAWGKDGHHLTCMIAKPLLSTASENAIHKLLPHGNFAELCSWADDVRRSYKYHWSGPLHYIDTPDNLCGYSYQRDCHNEHGEQDMCVAGAINNYTTQLQSYHQFDSKNPRKFLSLDSSSYNLTEALLFLSHYVGDIHQPLHVGFTNDAGGNGIHVHWYKRKMNLHHIWDTEFISHASQLYYHSISRMADSISMNITKSELVEWNACDDGETACPDSYALESIQAACKWAYKDACQNCQLGDDYFYSRLSIVEQRLAQGGVRLAAILNRIFSSETASII